LRINNIGCGGLLSTRVFTELGEKINED
jgi:hypothetical protein